MLSSYPFKVRRKSAVRLLIQLGCSKAASYHPNRLRQRLTEVGQMPSEGLGLDLPSERLRRAILDALARGEELEIITDTDVDQYTAVELDVLSILREATGENRIKKPQILAALAKKYPSASTEALREVIDDCLPRKFREGGLDVRREAKAYWIASQ